MQANINTLFSLSFGCLEPTAKVLLTSDFSELHAHSYMEDVKVASPNVRGYAKTLNNDIGKTCLMPMKFTAASYWGAKTPGFVPCEPWVGIRLEIPKTRD